MPDLAKLLPAALARQSRFVRLGPGQIPALLAHPDWTTPAPTVIWMHGRTVTKELDNGRYLRWIRAGMAACAIDLPGHGERLDPEFHKPERLTDLLAAALPEVDQAVAALADPAFGGVFDLTRLAIGGMSAGGMVTLRRLATPHPFIAAGVESTAGDPASVATWQPVPLLALHSEADRLTPVAGMRAFTSALAEHYAAVGADPSLVEFVTWPTTGAPDEHSGFGRVANEAKTRQVEFLTKILRPTPPIADI